MAEKILFISESVAEGHPDKIADQISVSVLDAALAQNPFSRVACEVFNTTNMDGEIAKDAQLHETDRKYVGLTPAAIIDMPGLSKPQYRQVGAYGHFGRIDLDTPWERTDKAEELKQSLLGVAGAGQW